MLTDTGVYQYLIVTKGFHLINIFSGFSHISDTVLFCFLKNGGAKSARTIFFFKFFKALLSYGLKAGRFKKSIDKTEWIGTKHIPPIPPVIRIRA
ncbi:MAG: hypothetical protein CVV34_00185 [Methanomicrobiales archaeon HGW-Methanomicrobiales-5]|nr:MAG: hypothetical protein CVV34_00185 [Methanomicrobiales archaeon HGW-Methanomicrobiales-5]